MAIAHASSVNPKPKVTNYSSNRGWGSSITGTDSSATSGDGITGDQRATYIHNGSTFVKVDPHKVIFRFQREPPLECLGARPVGGCGSGGAMSN